MRTAILALALLATATGCLGTPEGTPTPTAPIATSPSATPEPMAGPVVLYDATIDFSLGTTGDLPLDVPAAARHLTLTVQWHSDSPATLTGDVTVEILDKNGDAAASCGYAVGVSQPDAQGCEQTNSATNPPYKLTWDGTGTVSGDVVVTAE